MDPKILETLFIAVSNGVALYIGAYLARRAAEMGDRRRAEYEEKAELQRTRRDGLLERLALQRRALDDYARVVVRWSSAASALPAGRAKEEGFAADQESIALYAQMASAFGSRQFAEQAAATLHAVRAGRDNPQLFPFSVQIASACYQEMIRAMSELEKELGLPAPRAAARPFLPDEELAKEATRLFSRNMMEHARLDLGMVDQMLERVRTSSPSGEHERIE